MTVIQFPSLSFEAATDVQKLEKTVVELQHEVARLRDIEAVRRVHPTFASYIEQGLYEDVPDLLANSKIIEVEIEKWRWMGREGVERLLACHCRAMSSSYLFMETMVELEEDSKSNGEAVAWVRGGRGFKSVLVKEKGKRKIWKSRWAYGGEDR